MGLLSYLRDKKTENLMTQSTTSGIGKDLYDDWAAMTEAQGGYYSALTMSKNLQGIGLTFRCRPSDQLKVLSLSIAEKAAKYYFEPGKRYKVRLQFDNSIVLYGYMHAYKQRHVTIDNIVDDFIHNLFDSENLKLQYLGDNGKKITVKFSLKGSTPAINSSVARAKQHEETVNP